MESRRKNFDEPMLLIQEERIKIQIFILSQFIAKFVLSCVKFRQGHILGNIRLSCAKLGQVHRLGNIWQSCAKLRHENRLGNIWLNCAKLK